MKSWETNNYIPDVVQLQASFYQSRALAAIGKGKIKMLKDEDSKQEFKFCISTEEDPERPISRKVEKIYRTSDGKMYFIQTLRGQNYAGDKRVNVTQTVGKYKLPIYLGFRNRETGQKVVTGDIDRIDDVYNLPFTTGEFVDPSTGEKTTLEKLPKADDIAFYVISAGTKYGLKNLKLPDFLSRSVEDLVYYADHQQSWPPVETAASEKGKTR